MASQRVLVLGGTRFVGRHLVEALLAAGDEVVLFHRGPAAHPGAGLTDPCSVFSDLVHLHGDRRGDASCLAGTTWDVVYDTSAYLPLDIRTTTAQLRGRVGHYVLISTISVYNDFSERGISEQAPLRRWPESAVDAATEITGENYGPLKVACEQLTHTAFPSATVIRPGIVVGPHDPTDRFTYWCLAATRPGPHLVPAENPLLQVIDVRDLAAFTVRCGRAALNTTVNVAGPSFRFLELTKACAEAAGVAVDWQAWTPEQRRDAGVQPWLDLPLVLPDDDRSVAHHFEISTDHATGLGLVSRPLLETVTDTQRWALQERSGALAVGLSSDRERDLLG